MLLLIWVHVVGDPAEAAERLALRLLDSKLFFTVLAKKSEIAASYR
jgi:hypothetical protein